MNLSKFATVVLIVLAAISDAVLIINVIHHW